jgi:hypothetical protein
MKRRSLVVLVLFALAVGGVLACFRSPRPGLRYAEIEGDRYDEKTQHWIRVVVRVEDPRVLARVRPWRNAERQKEFNESVRRLERWIQGIPNCVNSLKQIGLLGIQRLTLVYEDGHREIVESIDVEESPFRDCWQEAEGKQLTDAP